MPEDLSVLLTKLNSPYMPEDLSVLLAKLNSPSDDSAATQTFDGHGGIPESGPPPIQKHICTKKEMSDQKSKAVLHEIKMLGIAKKNMLDWFEWLDNTINGRSPMHTVNGQANIEGMYSDERQRLRTLMYKIPYKFDLVYEMANKFYCCTQYRTFSNDSRDVHCRVTIYNNVRSVLHEMSVWKMRFREALDYTQQVTYDSLYNNAKESAESWMSVAAPRMGTQALAYSRASQVSNHRNALRGRT
jgi:hypothetical protein